MVPSRRSPLHLLLLLGTCLALVLVALPATASAQVRVVGVETVLQPTPAFTQLLANNDYVLNVVSPAGPRGDLIAFPITSGRVRVSGRRAFGFVNHGGGVAFARSGVSAAMTNFKVNFTRKPSITARSGVSRIKFLNLSSLSGRRVGTRLVIGADASLSTEGAVALNRAFQTTNFNTNQPVGRVQLEIRRR